MTVELICPHCHFSKKLSERKIPAHAKWAICPRCSQKFLISRMDPPIQSQKRSDDHKAVSPEEALQNSSPKSINPWENWKQIGLFRRIFLTVTETMFHPAHFFGKNEFGSGYKEALAFGLLIGGLGDMLTFFWPLMLFMGGMLPLGDMPLENVTGLWIFLTLMVFIPVGALLGMFFSSCLLHLMLLILRGASGGFEGTFRVVAYSQSALTWTLIPVVGNWVGGIWKLAIQIAGLRQTHHIGYLRVIMAYLLPFLILIGTILLAMGPLLMVIYR